jgi:hypothetical protein
MVLFCFQEWCPESAGITVRFAQESLSAFSKNTVRNQQESLSGLDKNMHLIENMKWSYIRIINRISIIRHES